MFSYVNCEKLAITKQKTHDVSFMDSRNRRDLLHRNIQISCTIGKTRPSDKQTEDNILCFEICFLVEKIIFRVLFFSIKHSIPVITHTLYVLGQITLPWLFVRNKAYLADGL